MRSAEISKENPENWKVIFLRDGTVVDLSYGFPSFEFAAETAKNWILSEQIG